MTSEVKTAAAAAPRYRAMRYGVDGVSVERRDNGICYLRADAALQPFAPSMGSRLAYWAGQRPAHTLFARRERLADGSLGDWVHLSYAQALEQARKVGQALLDRGLDTERPVVILGENSLEHAVLALACLYVGIPYCTVSAAYSTLATDYAKLRRVLETLTPGLVLAVDGAQYGRAIDAEVAEDCEVWLERDDGWRRRAGRQALWHDILATEAGPAVEAAAAAVTPERIAKFLFTSGSTKLPAAVINTHGMWCSNQQQLAQSIPLVQDEDLTMVDWLPWSHTFGGNHNFGIALYNGGSLYINDGRPTPGLIHETLRNLREIAPTVYFDVPTGFEAIAAAMRTDEQLRRNLLSRVKLFYYAAAGLAQPIWDALHACQEQELGERIVMGTGLGMTESSPFALFVNHPDVRAGDLGVPASGLSIKLVPNGDKLEVRYKGPNITPGYWRDPDATRAAFDEEGFLCTGDAVAWIDAARPERGLRFDGRISEDFKLSTGTFVSVGPLRTRVVTQGSPYVGDVVLTGLNQKDVGAMVFVSPAARALAGAGPEVPQAEVNAHPAVRAAFQGILDALAASATGSANRIARMVLLEQPPQSSVGEITDKGSINQRAVLRHRAALVEALHEGTAPGILYPSAKKKD